MTVLERRTRNTFGVAVTIIIDDLGLTQTELARGLKFSQSYVSDMLNGKRSPSGRWVDLVADALKLQEQERKKLHILAARDNGFDIELPKFKR